MEFPWDDCISLFNHTATMSEDLQCSGYSYSIILNGWLNEQNVLIIEKLWTGRTGGAFLWKVRNKEVCAV